MRPLLAAALVALLLAPGALAADPEPASWSPYNAVSPVAALALAAEGTTLAAALGMLPPPAPGAAPRIVTTDLAILDLGVGFAMNGTGIAQPPPGRSHVAVSRDGSTVASLGPDTKPSVDTGDPSIDPGNPGVPTAPTPSAATLRLAYQRAPPGANFSSNRAENHTAYLSGQAMGLALSDDGRRVAVLTNEAGSLVVRGFVSSASGLTPTFTYGTNGNASALAADGALTRLYVAGQAAAQQGGAPRAALLVIPFDRGVATASHVEPVDNGTYRAVAASRDGNVLVVGAPAGTLLAFDATGGVLGEPRPLQVGGASDAVTLVAVSEDGRRATAVAGRNLTHVDTSGAVPSARWSAAIAAPATSLALNRTGGLVAAAVPGEGVLAYGDETSDVIWRNAGAATSVALNAAGDVVAFGRNALVIALRIPRGLSLEHSAGQDAGPQKLVKPGATVSYDLVVRNTGAAPERVAFQGPADPTLLFSFEPPTVYVRPGETRRVTLLAEADPAFAGSRSLNVTAFALTSAARDDTTVRVGLQTEADVSIIANETDLVARPGEPTTLLLGLQNKGNRDAAVGVRVRQQPSAGAPWDVAVDPASLTLAPAARTTLRVVVTPPADVANGTSNVLTVSLEGQDVSDSATLTLRINPTVDLDVGAVGRMKFIQPGKVGHYNVTIRNSGSLAREFEAYYDLVPTEGAPARGWTVDMSTARFQLDAGATKTLPVAVRAPFDVTPSDRVGIRVTARLVPLNDTEAPLLRNVTLFANGEAAAPTPDEGGEGGSSLIPAPALPLVAAALVLVALLRRRLR